ncbi:DUF742 domain-containing protein, partial [Streptomyces sp. NPDC057020]|uniref:DUF742 domain-containing protein n=1 Tax=Streptomyces sp. NPDC057020 TaxID=3346002 RepID=UPI003628620F
MSDAAERNQLNQANRPTEPDQSAAPAHHHWFDDEAGPVVRPYAMTRGRTSAATRHRLDLIAVVVPEPAADDPGRDQTLSPEHVEIVERCSEQPQSRAGLDAGRGHPRGGVRGRGGGHGVDEIGHGSRPGA